MITVLINVLVACLAGLVLTLTDVSPWYWSVVWTILILIAGQFTMGWVLRRRMGSVSDQIQMVMKQGQARMQAKIQRWRVKPVSGQKAAEAELARDRDAMIAEVQAILRPLERYRLWIPLLGRQLATMELQFAWQKKDYARVDTLLPKALLIDPMLVCIRLARMWQKDESTEVIEKVFRRAVRRARYNTTALLYSVFAWMLVKRGDADAAYKVLIEADEKNEHAVIKSNRAILANNRIAHFTNAGFGDEWYALSLEVPKVHAKRQTRPGHYFG